MREFISNYRADFNINAQQTIETNQQTTIESYLKRFKGFCGHLPRSDLFETLDKKIDKFHVRRVAGKLKHSTIRQYKSCICFGVSLVVSNIPLDSEFVFLLKNCLTIDEARKLYEKASKLLNDETCEQFKVRENKAHAKANTSTTKYKGVPKGYLEAFSKLCKRDFTHIHLKAAQKFLQANCIVGLRPSEWYDVEILSIDELRQTSHYILQAKQTSEITPPFPVEDGDVYLCVKNFKNSQGRACGDYRYICIDNLSQREMSLVNEWLIKSKSYISELDIIDANDYYNRLMTKIQSAIRYANNETEEVSSLLNIENNKRKSMYFSKQRIRQKNFEKFNSKPPIRQVVTLYSTRHQAIANAKNAGLSELQIAAIFGHASVHTAKEHYGKIHIASGKSKLFPSVINVKQVILKSNRLELDIKQENTQENSRFITPNNHSNDFNL